MITETIYCKICNITSKFYFEGGIEKETVIMKIHQTEYNNPNFGAKLEILYKFPFEDRSIRYTNKYIEGDILEMRHKAKCIGGKNDIIEAIFSDWRVNNHEYASRQDLFYTSWQQKRKLLK